MFSSDIHCLSLVFLYFSPGYDLPDANHRCLHRDHPDHLRYPWKPSCCADSRISSKCSSGLSPSAISCSTSTTGCVTLLMPAGLPRGISWACSLKNAWPSGWCLIRVIARKEIEGLSEALNAKGYGTTTVDAHGKYDDVNVIFIIVKRKDIDNAISLIKQYNPKAFYTIEDIRYVSQPLLPPEGEVRRRRRFYLFNGWRKGK